MAINKMLFKCTTDNTSIRQFLRQPSTDIFRYPAEDPFTHATFDAIFVWLSNATFVASVN